MSRLTAEQILNLNILSNENSGDDSCDQSEEDCVEADLRADSDDEGDTDECDDEEENEDENEEENEEEDEDNELLMDDNDEEFENEPQVHILPSAAPQTAIIVRSNTVNMLSDERSHENNKIYGRVNKTKLVPFEWFEKPNKTFAPTPELHARIIPLLDDEKSIECFFKMFITVSMVERITNYTNKRISLIDNSKLTNESYKLKRNILENAKITPDEVYGFIGILILLGITKKSNVSIESLWKTGSLHYAPFAAATMSRERYQLISKNITFDDMDTRSSRPNQKFHKMAEIFNDIKENLAIVVPSFLLCIDEELYSFRGWFSFNFVA